MVGRWGPGPVFSLRQSDSLSAVNSVIDSPEALRQDVQLPFMSAAFENHPNIGVYGGHIKNNHVLPFYTILQTSLFLFVVLGLKKEAKKIAGKRSQTRGEKDTAGGGGAF